MDTYLIINKETGEFYIGSSINFTKRLKGHLRVRDNPKFHNMLQKHPDRFMWIVYQDDRNDRYLEQAFLDLYYGHPLCYNKNPDATKPPNNKGIKRPKQWHDAQKSNPRSKGKFWWTKIGSEENVMSEKCPGEGWVKGRNLASYTGKKRQGVALENIRNGCKKRVKSSAEGTFWWVNPLTKERKRSVTKPHGLGWIKGRKFPSSQTVNA